MSNKITVESTINAPIKKVWESFTNPEHITQWNQASDDWHSPRAENDLRVGGRFNFRMEARDGSAGFDFTGVYTEVVPHKQISYTMDDGRKADVIFDEKNGGTKVTTTFEAESQNSLELQKSGWQAILDNFKKYVEGK
jgi:uncharacterized protein YndB with AHSA1/START domain